MLIFISKFHLVSSYFTEKFYTNEREKRAIMCKYYMLTFAFVRVRGGSTTPGCIVIKR